MRARLRLGAALAALTLVASVGMAGVASAATSPGAISPGLTRVNLVNFNDFHGRIDVANGYKFACTIENEKASLGEDSTLVLSAGDNIGASLFVSAIQQDNPTLDVLNALGVSATAVGNHEFDRGFADLTGRVSERATFPQLGANVYERGTQTPALPEYVVREINGVRVGVVGAVTPETKSLVSPEGIQAIDFGDPIAAVNRVAAQLTDGNAANGEADVVVAEIHDGAPQGANDTPVPSPLYNRMIAELSPRVDVVFNGHTHAVYTVDAATAGGTRNISQAGSYGGGLTRVQLGIDPATKRVVEYVNDYVPTAVGGQCATDPDYVKAKGLIDEAVAQARVLGSVPIGAISADVTTAYSDAAPVNGVYTGTQRDDRMRESTLGNLVAQAWYEEMNVPGRAGADLGIMNPGGLRADLLYKSSAAGEGDGVVTYEEAAAVNPFANTLVVKDITGAQVKTLLEQQWQPAGSSRAFLNLGLSNNVTYTFDPVRAAGSRVTSVTLNGAPLDPKRTYTVASSSFLMAGGDNFTVMQEGTNTRDSGLVDTEAFMNFMKRTGMVAPSFAKRGVGVLAVPATLVRGQASGPFRIEGVDLTSLGAPVNTEFAVLLEGRRVGTFVITPERVATPLPVRDGVATGMLTLKPEQLRGLNAQGSTVTLTLVAKESGTTIVLPAIPLVKKPITVRATALDCNSFGFAVDGELPQGSRLRVAWERDGARQYTVVAPTAWWSGNAQAGWTNATATVIGADGAPLATSGAAINPQACATVVPTSADANSFGFAAQGPLPDGALLRITWLRDGQRQQTTVPSPWWSGRAQTGWSNAQAVLIDAKGEVWAKSAVINPTPAQPTR